MFEDLIVLREILQRELETINAYEQMLGRVSDPALRQIIDHVTDEEREHVAEMYYLIMQRDPRQEARSVKSREQLREMSLLPPKDAAGTLTVGEEQTAAAAAGLREALLSSKQAANLALAADPDPSPAPIFPDGAWSVGSLKRSPAK